MKNNSLKNGAIILIITGFFNRILGFLYKIFMVRLVGPEGIGLFQMILPIFSFILVITTAGIPPTISKLVSEYLALGKPQQAKKTFKLALLVLTFTSICLTIISWLTAPYIVKKILLDSRVYWAYLTLLPAIIVISFSSVFKGYFMGYKNMIPSAISQVFETVIRFCIGLLSSSFLLKFGLDFAIVGFSLGIVLGEVIGLATLLWFYKKQKLSFITTEGSTLAILKKMNKLALPITLNRMIATLISSIHAVLIPMRLESAGFTIREATSLYGQLSGIAYTIISLPSILTVSLAITLVPAISEAQAAKNYFLIRKRSALALKYTLLAGIPWAVIFYILSSDLTTVLFKSPEAGIPLKMMALGCIFIYLQQTTNGILQGMGKVNLILKNSLIGAFVNISGVYLLTSTSLGIKGTALALNISALIVSGLNLINIFNMTCYSFRLFKLIFLTISTLVMGIGVWYFDSLLHTHIAELQILVIVIIIGLLIYLTALIVFGFITFRDIKRLPFVEDIFKFFSF